MFQDYKQILTTLTGCEAKFKEATTNFLITQYKSQNELMIFLYKHKLQIESDSRLWWYDIFSVPSRCMIISRAPALLIAMTMTGRLCNG